MPNWDNKLKLRQNPVCSVTKFTQTLKILHHPGWCPFCSQSNIVEEWGHYCVDQWEGGITQPGLITLPVTRATPALKDTAPDLQLQTTQFTMTFLQSKWYCRRVRAQLCGSMRRRHHSAKAHIPVSDRSHPSTPGYCTRPTTPDCAI